MKIGDIVRSTKVRPGETAKIIDVDISTKMKETKKGYKKEVRSKYIAEYPDKSTMTFYGFDINRFVFKVEDDGGQLSLDDLFSINGGY